MKIYRSQSHNPFDHLFFEDWLLRSSDAPTEALYFYQNIPCVVMGRFQNPWLETNLRYLKENDIEFVRRMSGGGCVYQDLGNLNISWVGPLNGFKRTNLLHLIQNHLLELNVSVELNERHDLILRGETQEAYKISGSAFKQTKNRALHHATLLFCAKMNHLSASLKTPHQNIVSKSIPSVRSKVANLNDYYPGLTLDQFISSFGQAESDQGGHLVTGIDYADREWKFGETPQFTWGFDFKGLKINLESKKGRIISADIFKASNALDASGLKDQWLCALSLFNWSEGASLNISLQEWQDIIGC